MAIGQYDLYVLFIELACELLNSNGILSFIVPTRLLSNENFYATRLFIMNHLPINIYVNAETPFDTASVEANIMICVKGNRPDCVKSYTFNNRNGLFNITATIKWNIVDKMPFLIFPFVYNDRIMSVFLKLQKFSSHPLGCYTKITRGIECGYKDSCITNKATGFRLIKSEQIKRYFIDNNCYSLYCIPDFSNKAKFKSKDVFENKPKLVTKFCSQDIQFALDTEGYYNTNSVYNCTVQDDDTAFYLLGVLNCPLTTFWFNVAYMNIDGLFPHIQKNQLESLPIPDFDNTKKFEIISLVKQYFNCKDKRLLTEINSVVFNFYHLTNDEIQVIENDSLSSSSFDPQIATSPGSIS